MADKGSPKKFDTTITLAIIGLLSAAIVAAISNADKLANAFRPEPTATIISTAALPPTLVVLTATIPPTAMPTDTVLPGTAPPLLHRQPILPSANAHTSLARPGLAPELH